MDARNSWRKVWDEVKARVGERPSQRRQRQRSKLRSLTLEFLEQRAMMATCTYLVEDHALQECDCGCGCQSDASKQNGQVGDAQTKQDLTTDKSITSTNHSNTNPHPVITPEVRIPDLDG